MPLTSKKYNSVLLLALPLLISLLVFIQTKDFEAISYDDPAHIYENAYINKGISPQGIQWAITQTGSTNLWHPVTWFSFILDVEIFGLNNHGAHHLVNVGFHILATVFLYFIILHYTKNPWLAVILCCLWAIHPHRAHNVAWISQRKDVLAMSFMLAAWLLWLKSNRSLTHLFTWASIICFTLSILSKPSGLGLPFILLTSDYLLMRKSLVKGKIPLIILMMISLATAALTIYFQKQGNLAALDASSSIISRVINLPYTLWWYVEASIFSNGALWVYSPNSYTELFIKPCIGLTIITFGLIYFRKNKLICLGAITVLCFWLPVSGITSVSTYIVAERYSYFIQMGYLILIAGAHLFIKEHWTSLLRDRALILLGSLAIIISTFITYQRTNYWRNDKTLFTHEASINPRSLLAHIFLGIEEKRHGRNEQAISYFEQAIKLDKESGLSFMHLGDCYTSLAQPQKAVKYYTLATKAKTLNSASAFQKLAILQYSNQDYLATESTLLEGLDRFPTEGVLHLDLGNLYLKLQNFQKAQQHFELTLKFSPDFLEAKRGIELCNDMLNNS